jgi:hypothetical protein
MAITEIPTTYRYACDVCGKIHEQKHKSLFPTRWSHLTLAAHSYDYAGSAVADGTITRLLCDDCTPKVAKVINDATEKS